jgi:hypothetical protein
VEHPDPRTQDVSLRALASQLVVRGDVEDRADWEAFGKQLIACAQRDARHWPGHAAEYTSEYIAHAVELVRRRPSSVVNADSPWGYLVSASRRAGSRAVGAEVACGLTARDPLTHRSTFAGTPRVVSLDQLIEEGRWPHESPARN